ncbi:hypothetical protein, partial [Burkholderia multivorans]|uniref:hypothetical protein n=1 Tax=Burkholderia multivorans TaxID=87883 RepID=UPI00195531CC
MWLEPHRGCSRGSVRCTEYKYSGNAYGDHARRRAMRVRNRKHKRKSPRKAGFFICLAERTGLAYI